MYTSALKSGEDCPRRIQESVAYITAEGVLRDAGDTNTVIDELIGNSASAGMRSDDFMFYYADIFVEAV